MQAFPISVFTGVAQLVEQWSPKPLVGSSSLSTRAKIERMTKVIRYIKESADDLINKVSWPTWKELQSSSIVVAIASLIIALIVYLMDLSFRNVMEVFYGLF